MSDLVRARVEYREDPLQLGRVKIRIPAKHGIPELHDDALKVDELPWARRVNRGYGGYDMGSFLIPPVGSFVWVEKEGDKWVYLGGVDGRDSKKAHEMGVIGDLQEEDNVYVGKWEAPKGENEIPKDVFDGKDSDVPTRDVIYKSYKGSTLIADDEDEKESLSIIDRVGQIFKFISPVKEDKNRTGDESFKRGVRNSVKEDHFDYEEDLVDSKAIVFLKDLATQVFRYVSEYAKEKIELISRGKEKVRRTILKLAGGEENLGYLILSEDDDTGNRVYIKSDPINNKYEEKVIHNEGKEMVKKEVTGDGINIKIWNKPVKVEIVDEDGSGISSVWSDEKDEEMIE